MKQESDSWIVIKLGGASVVQPRCWDNVAALARERRQRGQRVLIVQSALAGVTNTLEALLAQPEAGARQAGVAAIESRHSELAGEMHLNIDAALAPLYAALRRDLADPPDARIRARVLAAGELLASRLGVACLAQRDTPATLIDARDWLTMTASPRQSARAGYVSAGAVAAAPADSAARLAEQGDVLLTQGFIAANPAGETVLLGRGGSDTSAAHFAALVGAEQLEIRTDVAGLFSADPREVPSARLLAKVDYDEAQEISTSGAKVLHPRCIGPARSAGVPIRVCHATDQSVPGTWISNEGTDHRERVKAISVRRNITLITLSSVGMWHKIGFLADAFTCFKRHGLSIDLISTSQTSVTVSLDPLGDAPSASARNALLNDLNTLGDARAIEGLAAISLVGRRMRANLHRLAPALELFEQRRVYLLNQAANDLNLTFVVDADDAARLARELHARLIRPIANDPVLGPTFRELTSPPPAIRARPPWWAGKRDRLLSLAGERGSLFVYDIDSVRAAAARLLNLAHANRIFFSIKANHHPAVLRALHSLGLGFECVAPGELAHVRQLFPGLSPDRLLYTPNFAPRGDYEMGYQAGAQVTLDNLYPLRAWPGLFRDREVFLRVDPGRGAGHHQHVRTAGEQSKFGIVPGELPDAAALAANAGARVVGLHAHSGSGIFDPGKWRETGLALAEYAGHFPDVGTLDLGGGLGVPESPEQPALDLAALDAALADVKAARPDCAIWLEPGRYLTAAAGVLLAQVTQIKGKGEMRYLGVDTGMNSLIRPALYGAWHPIVNLTRYGEEPACAFDIVGPICESGDVLGRGRLLPDSREGDVILIGNAGAYGRVMSSHYNLREPAGEAVV